MNQNRHLNQVDAFSYGRTASYGRPRGASVKVPAARAVPIKPNYQPVLHTPKPVSKPMAMTMSMDIARPVMRAPAVEPVKLSDVVRSESEEPATMSQQMSEMVTFAELSTGVIALDSTRAMSTRWIPLKSLYRKAKLRIDNILAENTTRYILVAAMLLIAASIIGIQVAVRLNAGASAALVTQKPADSNYLLSYTVDPLMPKRITIASIGVEARVLQHRDANTPIPTFPSTSYDASWDTASSKPGDGEMMILTAHGRSGVFATAHNLEHGDLIGILTGNDTKHVYMVTNNEVFDTTTDAKRALIPRMSAKKSMVLMVDQGPNGKVSVITAKR